MSATSSQLLENILEGKIQETSCIESWVQLLRWIYRKIIEAIDDSPIYTISCHDGTLDKHDQEYTEAGPRFPCQTFCAQFK